MTRIRIACAGYRGQLSNYWRELDALEMSDEQSRTKTATQARWRAAAPADVGFVPRVPAEIALTDFRGPVAEAWWTRCLQVVERLPADTVLLRTGPEFRPTADNRRALVAFFAPRRRAGLNVAWRAEGLWDGQPEDRNAVCAEAGLVPVVDPLGIEPEDRETELPSGGPIYWRLLGRPGGGTRFSESDLQDVLSLLAFRESGYVVFGSGWMTGDARRLRALLDVHVGARGDPDDTDAEAP
jgi:uncharacterized protein YecE (DUF72 family)